MGNYYGGELELGLNPSKIKISNLIDILSKPEYTSESGILYISIDPVYNFAKLGVKPSDVYDYEIDVKLNDTPTNPNPLYDLLIHDSYELKWITNEDIEKIESKWEFIDSLDVLVSVNTKYYNSLGIEDKILNLIEELKQYKFKHDKECLGEIQDEDQNYKRDFYWNKEDLDSKIKEREYLCGKCDRNIYEYHLCQYFSICRRAYDIGLSISKKE